MPPSVDFHRQSQLWQSIQQIPDSVLSDYLADGIIDEAEIEDISLRLEAHMSSLSITPDDHAMIRQMVRQALAHLQKQQQNRASGIAAQLGSATLGDIRNVMGHLLQSGQIALNVTHADKSEPLSPSASIPDERPDDYDESAENPLN